MSTAKVFRPVTDWRGQTVGELDDHYIGDVTGVVMGGLSTSPTRNFPGVVDTSGQVGIPFEQASGITVQQHDRVFVEGKLWAVTSDRLYTGANVLTGTLPSYYWLDVESTS